MAGIIVRISRPNEAVVGHVVPFFARHFTGFATDAHSRIGEKPNLDFVTHVRMPALIRTVGAFADHGENKIRKAGTQENRVEDYSFIRSKYDSNCFLFSWVPDS